MPVDFMFEEAIDAVKQGQHQRGRDILTRLLRADQSNADYWLWMSTVVETAKERDFCLKSAQRLDPENQAVRRGLILNGSLRPTEDEVPWGTFTPRQWEVKVEQEPPTGLAAIWANPVVRLLTIGGLGLVVVVLVLVGIFAGGARRAAVAVRPTNTSGPPPTFTLTPTFISANTSRAPTATPTFTGPTPL